MDHDEIVQICLEMVDQQLRNRSSRAKPSNEIVYWYAKLSESNNLSEDIVRKLFQHMIDIRSNYLDSPAYKRIRVLACQLRHLRYVRLWQRDMLKSTEDCDELRRALWQEQRGVFEPLVPTPRELVLDPFWRLDYLGSELSQSKTKIKRFTVDLPTHFTVTLDPGEIGLVIVETDDHEFALKFWNHHRPEWWDIRIDYLGHLGWMDYDEVIAIGRDLADLEARDRGDFIGYLNPDTIGFPQWGDVLDFLIVEDRFQIRVYCHQSQEKVTILISEPTGNAKSNTSQLASQLLGSLLGSMDPGLQDVALKLIDDDEE